MTIIRAKDQERAHHDAMLSQRITQIEDSFNGRRWRAPSLVKAFVAGATVVYIAAAFAFYGLITTSMLYLPRMTASGIAALWPVSFGSHLVRVR